MSKGRQITYQAPMKELLSHGTVEMIAIKEKDDFSIISTDILYFFSHWPMI